MAQLFPLSPLSTHGEMPPPTPLLPPKKNSPKSHDCGIETLDASVELTEIWIVLASAETWVRGPAAVTQHVCPRRLICRRDC